MIKLDINQLNSKYTQFDVGQVLADCHQLLGGKLAFASSLGLEDQVLTHFIARHCPEIRIFTLDTGRLFPETYDLIARTNARYKTNIEVFFPDAAAVEEMVKTGGVNLFYESIGNRKMCCTVRKTQPLDRALTGLNGWITGLRKDQSVTRTHMEVIEWDAMHGLYKINPLINWSAAQINDFIKAENIPVSPLHAKGFPSIGCQPCTRAISPDEDIRAGRWWWENPEQKECGLHKK
ncbi:MAG: phosphoadenylyl-sulfate reductase [Bacteroidetes bacterium]|nr:phosphoadenylyl-sulfate reductase [Bacteroidota bacterium]